MVQRLDWARWICSDLAQFQPQPKYFITRDCYSSETFKNEESEKWGNWVGASGSFLPNKNCFRSRGKIITFYSINIISVQELCIDVIDNETLRCVPPMSVKSDKGMQARFTRVFDQGTSQAEVFQTICRPMVSRVLNGTFINFNF